MRKEIPGLPDDWQNFLSCMTFHMVLPLSPLGFEYLFTQHIDMRSLVVVASTYAIAIGITSGSTFFFGLGNAVGFVFAGIYGHLLSESASNSGALADHTVIYASIVAIVGIFFIHLLERYNRHVVKGKPFFPWQQ